MNTIKSALRMLSRFKIYTWISISGLALSLACIIVIVRYVHHELTVNHFCPDLEQTYLIAREFQDGELALGNNESNGRDPHFIDPLQGVPVDRKTRCINFPNDLLRLNSQQFSVKTIVTDSMFLQILPYPLLAGSATLQRPDDAIITRRLAERLFGTDDPLGKTVVYSTGKEIMITGIIDTPPTKSSFDFDLLVSSRHKEHWSRMSYDLIVFPYGTNVDLLNQKNRQFMTLEGYAGRSIRLQFFPLKKFYHNSTIHAYENEKQIILHGNASNVAILSIVAFILLLIGVFNFINMYTVMMLKRAREFGVKKVYGADARNIFLQILAENLFMTGISLFMAWFLIEITESLLEHTLGIPCISNASFNCLLTFGIGLALPLLTSVYPFLRYYYKSPATSLRTVNVGGYSIVSRATFLFFQYVMTFTLIIISLFFVRQLRFMLNADLGYQTKNIIQCRLLSRGLAFDITTEEARQVQVRKELRNVQHIRQKLENNPLFSSWEFGENPNQLDGNFVNLRNINAEDYQQVIYSRMSNKYMELFDLQLKEGRLWNDSVDQWTDYKMIINESAQNLFGIDRIETALLQPEVRLWWSSEGDMGSNPPYQVLGVVKDFKIGHLSKANPPLIIVYEPESSPYGRFMGNIMPGKKQEAITFLNQLRNEVAGEGDFEYTFLEDEITAMYKEDQRITKVYTLFSAIAIIISCLGLFGLSMFDIRQRYREIALRKVNGATGREILLLLLKKYVYLLVGASLISIPLSWYFIQLYLNGFAHKATISLWLFIVAIMITIFITFITLVWQIRKAARINPATILKGE